MSQETHCSDDSQIVELLNQVLANSEKITANLKEVERLVASRTV